MMVIIFLVVSLPIFLLGLAMRRGKGLMLLSGYNTMPRDVRDSMDKERLAKLAGNTLIRFALVFMLMGLAFQLGITALGVGLLVVAIADPIIMTVRMQRMAGTHAKRRTKAGIAAAVCITAIMLTATGWMIYTGDKDPSVVIEGGELHIDCMFGMDMQLDNIASVELDERPADSIAPGAMRTKGYGGFGHAMKGSFKSKDIGSFKMFVQADCAPTIVMKSTDNKLILLSMKNAQDTQDIYSRLDAVVD